MADNWTPYGSQTLSKQPARFGAAYPGPAVKGEGPYLFTADNRRYVDWIMGLAACPLGYAHPAIDRAISDQLRRGVSFSLPTALEEQVAEQLCQLMPWAEQVRIVKTGSESTEAAIRMARMATGREVIAICEDHYHGWHSWSTAAKPVHPGVPKTYESLIRTFRYNDLHSVEGILSRGNVAGLIMEPVTFTRPIPGFLASVRALCDHYGALFILDEMVTGFRWPCMSAQAYYGVIPDLACFGKGLANGMPLACVLGKREVMQDAWAVSGTFGGETLSLAAAGAALPIHAQSETQLRLWEIGEHVQTEMRKQIVSHRLPASVEGRPPRLRLTWQHEAQIRLMSLWLQQCQQRGVLFHPGGWTGSIQHRRVIPQTLEATEQSFAACQYALETGDWSALKEPLIEPLPIRN